MEISKQDVGFDIDQLELASRLALSEASDQQHGSRVESYKESSDSSDSETSSDDDDDDGSSSSSDSFVTASSAELDSDDIRGRSDDGNSRPSLTVEHSSLVIENSAAAAAAAAAAAVEPTEIVCQQLSSLTVSGEHQVTPSSLSPLSQSHDNTRVQP